MMTISKYLLLLIVILFAQNAVAQDGDAVFNKIVKEYTLNEDGSTAYREYKEVKLLSHMSFHRLYGETFVIFDPKYQEIVINEAYTIMKDGQKVVVPDNAFNEVLPRAASHSAPYNRLRELVITHTGLEVGATIYLDYTLKTKAGFMQTFMGEEVIKTIVPIKEKKLIVRIPAGQELQYKVLNLRTSAEVSEEKGMKVYTFTFSGLSASSREWGVDHELDPHLFFSTAKDLDRAYFPFVAQKAFTYPANADMVSAAQQLKKDNEDELNAALAIQKMVVNEIGTWNLSLQYTGFRCRTPEEVWRSNAGTPLEKNVLLATLLMKAGFAATPVAIIPEKYYDKQVGSLYIFDGFAVQLKLASGDALYLSATRSSSQNLAVSLQGKKFLVLDGAIESLKTYDPIDTPAEIIYHGNLSLDAGNKLSGKIHVKLTGNANPYFSLYQDTNFAKRYGSGVKDVALNDLNPGESLFDLNIEKDKACEKYGEYVFMDIPVSRSGISSWGFSYIETGRSIPIRLNEAIHEQYNYMIDVPDGYELISPDVDFDIDNVVGHVKISLRQEKSKVFVTREIRLKKTLVKYSEFDTFNELWKVWMNDSFQKLVLKTAE